MIDLIYIELSMSVKSLSGQFYTNDRKVLDHFILQER